MNKIRIKLFSILILAAITLNPFAAEANSDSIRLRKQDRSSNTAFSVMNMFPGDTETKNFNVTVSHQKPITLYYHADIRPGYEKLAEVLKVKIYLPDKEKTLYDGLMRDMPNSLEHRLMAKEKEVTYQITAYLDTSVGNEYQRKSLIADFRWWYESETGTSGGGTGGGIGGGIGGMGSSGGQVEPGGIEYAKVKLTAEVIMDGQYPRGNDFSFTLKNQNGNKIQTVKNRDGLIEFDTLTYSREGVYNYYIIQEQGTNGDIEYDKAVYKVTVNVKKQGNTYVTSVTYEKDGVPYLTIPRFSNITKGSVQPDAPDRPGTDAPTDPGATVEPGKTEDTGATAYPSNPKTGDDSNINLYLSMFGLSMLAIILLLLFASRKKEN